ncbi:MAG: DUF2085 domain-containing protein [Candidatus Nanohaloarchaea archaeon]
MQSTSRTEEFRKGLKETRRHLLSHHRDEELYRCYKVRGEHLCSRCTGIYPGILAGLYLIFSSNPLSIAAVALSGVPTLIEKFFTGVKNFKGYNTVRTGSGLLLGAGYINGLYLLIQNPFNPEILSTGLFYITAGLLLLYLEKK